MLRDSRLNRCVQNKRWAKITLKLAKISATTTTCTSYAVISDTQDGLIDLHV